ncbi:MAG: EI24 domain-containing protein [Pseudobdellovibrionaceae bacterium]
MSDLFYGIAIPFRGLSLIAKMPRALWLCFWPFIIYSVLFSFGILTFAKYIIPWVVTKAGAVLVDWGIFNSFFSVLLEVFAWIWALLMMTFVIFLVARIVASPFYSLLAEKTLVEVKAIKTPQHTLISWIKFNLKMIWVSIVESIVFGFLGLFLLIFSFVPGLNIIAAFCILLIVAYDSANYGYEVIGFGFKERFGFFKKNIAGYFGLAGVLTLTSLLPGLNFVLFPAAVVGSTLYLAKKRVV